MSSKEEVATVKRDEDEEEMEKKKETQKEEGEEEDDDEEYEEAEPVLTYSRMKNDFKQIFVKDSVTCIKAASKVSAKI